MSPTAALQHLPVSSQQANLRLDLNQEALDLVNGYINEPSFVMEVIGGNITGTPKRILLFDKKPYFKEFKESLPSDLLQSQTPFTISGLVDGNKYAFEFHIKYGDYDFYSSAIEVEPHSFPLAPIISTVTSGNNGMLITLNSIRQNTIDDGFVDISNVHFVLINVEESSTGRDIQVTSKPFVYGTGVTQSYELRNSQSVTIENNNTYEVCAYYENEFGERSPLSNTQSVLVSPKPNEVQNFAAVVDDASLCIVLSWHAPVGTYLAPGPPINAGAFTNDANVLDVDSIIDYYNITRTSSNGQVLNIQVLTASGDYYTFTYKDSASLVPGLNYVYTIVAHNKYGDGTAAPEGQAPVEQIYYTRPTSPSNVEANPIPDRVSELKIQWSTPSNFSTNGCVNNGYVLERYTVDACGNNPIPDSSFAPTKDLSGNLIFINTSTPLNPSAANTNAYIDRTATVGQKYKYAVNVKCNNPNPPSNLFESPLVYSNPVTALEPPDAPRNLVATAGNNRITYTWNAPSDNTWDDPNDSNPDLVIAGYALVVKLAASLTTLTPVTIEASGNSYSYTVTGLTNGSAYNAEVTSFVSSNGTKVYSQSVNFPGPRTPYGPALAITTLSCASTTSNEAKNTLTWDGSVNLLLNGGDFVNYTISRTSTTDASAVILANITNEAIRLYEDSSCNQGVTYTYSFFIKTKDKDSSTTVNGTAKSVTGTPSSQPDIYDISGNGTQLTVRFYQNGSQVTSLLAVGVASSSDQNMVKQVTGINIPLGTSNALQTYSVTLGSPATNGGLVVIGNTRGFAYQVLDGTPAVILDGSSASAPTLPQSA